MNELVSFLPVLAYDGTNMIQIDAGGILDIAMAGTSATLLARKWESALVANVDNNTLRRILDNSEAMAAVGHIEGWRSLGNNIIEAIINQSEKVKELNNKAKDRELTEKQKKQLSEAEREYKSMRKRGQEKLSSSPRASQRSWTSLTFGRTRSRMCSQNWSRIVSGRDRPEGEGLPPARAPNGVQHRTDEPRGVRLPPLRRHLAPLHWHREPSGVDPLRALRHRGGAGPIAWRPPARRAHDGPHSLSL